MKCNHCGAELKKPKSEINRAARNGMNLYCDKKCAGLGRRMTNPPTAEQRKAAKAAYDARRRIELADRIKAQKAEWFQRTYDPIKAAVLRKQKMPRHLEYCRRPEYKAWKSEYDRAHKAKKLFGEFAEVALLLSDLEQEINEQATRYEIHMTNGTFNKAQRRRRAL